jgi:outer membrane protein assembly factor BamD
MIAGCSGYEKILKSSDVELKYRKAFEYYYDEDYARASTLFEQLMPLTRGTGKADSVHYFLAKSLYGQKDYILAGHYFGEFAEEFPRNKMATEAEFMSAYTSYLMSPRPSLDQSNTYKAIQEFQFFIVKHPEHPRVNEARELIAGMQDKLVEKSYMSAKLYFDLGDYKAAIIALQNSLNTYPDTKFREELMFLILKSHYLLARNSIPEKQRTRFQDTVDEYYSFTGEFPESKYTNEAKTIYEKSSDYLNLTIK